ncbi:hypothetical protein AVEN_190330-1 [Araneus ventricosus]|uniref:Uncharacterized protein n=1 Tax=Araneus ventricosus TaxID=182803 RepID=A0A4Y2GP81_ARAVE|nr:hypothetical protein AVEN_190330-1 [Araneus ventricosus]
MWLNPHFLSTDTTSALFNYVKLKFVQTLKNNTDLLNVIEIFKNPDMTLKLLWIVATWFRFATAHQQSLKVYYQIQHWPGNKKRHGDWGFERINSKLQPVKTLKSPAPDSILYARYPASVRRGAQEIAAVGRSDCFVQCCILIVGATAITERRPVPPCLTPLQLLNRLNGHRTNCNNRGIQVINSDEDDDGEPTLPDGLVEASLSFHVEEDTGDL